MKYILFLLLLISTYCYSQKPVPGKIENEDWTNMFSVQAEPTIDEGGGKNVGFIQVGSWMEYLVNVANTGKYTMNLRIASVNICGIEIKDGNNILATAVVPNTGGYQMWQTVQVTINLTKGITTIRLTAITAGWNINWMDFVYIEPPVVTPPPVTIPPSDDCIYDTIYTRRSNNINIDTFSFAPNTKVKFKLSILADGSGEKNVTISRNAAGKYTLEKDVNIESYVNWIIQQTGNLIILKLRSQVKYVYTKEILLTL